MAKDKLLQHQKAVDAENGAQAINKKARNDNKQPSRSFTIFVLVIAFISQTLSMGFFLSYGTFYVELIKIFKTSETTAAWIGSIAISVCLGIGLITSLLIKRLGDGLMISLGGATLGLGLISCSIATNTLTLAISFSGVMAVGCSFLYFASFSVLPRYFTSRLCIAISLTSSGYNFGGITFSPLMVYLIKNYNFKTCFQMFSIATVIPIIGGLVIQRYSQATGDVENKKQKDNESSKSYRSLFKNKRLMLVFLAMALVELCYFIPYVHLVNFGIHNGISMMKASWLPVTLSICALFGKILFGMISQIKYLSIAYLFQIFLLGMAVCLTLLPLATTYSHLMSFSAIYGVFDGGFVCFILPIVATTVPAEQVNLAFGTLNTFISLEILFGAPLAGLIYTQTSSYTIPFLLCGGFMLASAIILFWLPEKIETEESKGDETSLIGDVKENQQSKQTEENDKQSLRVSKLRRLFIQLRTECVLTNTSEMSCKLLTSLDLKPKKSKERFVKECPTHKSNDINTPEINHEDTIKKDEKSHEEYSTIDDSFDKIVEVKDCNNKKCKCSRFVEECPTHKSNDINTPEINHEDTIKKDEKSHEEYSTIDDSFEKIVEVKDCNNKKCKCSRYSHCKRKHSGRTVHQPLNLDETLDDQNQLLCNNVNTTDTRDTDSQLICPVIKEHSIIDLQDDIHVTLLSKSAESGKLEEVSKNSFHLRLFVVSYMDVFRKFIFSQLRYKQPETSTVETY